MSKKYNPKRNARKTKWTADNPPSREDVYRNSPTRFRRRKLRGANIAALLCCVILFGVIIISIYFIVKRDKPEPNDKNLDTIASTAASESTEDNLYEYVVKKREDVHSGALILVNYENEYVFPEKKDLINVYENKSGVYKVAYSDYMLSTVYMKNFNAFMDDFNKRTGDNCILVNSAYRSLEEQTEIYESFAVSSGLDYAEKYVADPGYSEHHTGLAADITIRYDDGKSALIKDYENLPLINSMCADYGFIVRYPDDKVEYTKINSEPWHYRYVGVPHSYIIGLENMCLEEYTSFIREYDFDKKVLCIDSAGTLSDSDKYTSPDEGYLIYFVPAGENETELPVQKAADSTEISGNNIDGFVVTSCFGDVVLPEVSFSALD